MLTTKTANCLQDLEALPPQLQLVVYVTQVKRTPLPDAAKTLGISVRELERLTSHAISQLITIDRRRRFRKHTKTFFSTPIRFLRALQRLNRRCHRRSQTRDSILTAPTDIKKTLAVETLEAIAQHKELNPAQLRAGLAALDGLALDPSLAHALPDGCHPALRCVLKASARACDASDRASAAELARFIREIAPAT